MPAEMVMEAEDLVDAALLGFDRGEVVTIPPLQDEGQWQTLRNRAPRHGAASLAARGGAALQQGVKAGRKNSPRPPSAFCRS
jgi:short-subunit dehydrogenase